MSKALAGKCVPRYTIPISNEELNSVIDIIKKAFNSFGITYEIEVTDDEEKKSKDKQSWTYGLFAERKHISVKIANMTDFTRDFNKTLYSPISEIIFTLSKERGVSTYEKLQQIDDSLQHYPKVVPYCDMSLFNMVCYTNGWYRYYRCKHKYKLEHVTSDYSHYMFSSNIDEDFINALTGYISSICKVKKAA